MAERRRLMRPRLTDRLAKAAAFPITLVVAPVGFGKSTAVRDFLLMHSVSHRWYDARLEAVTANGFLRAFLEALGIATAADHTALIATSDRAGRQRRADLEITSYLCEQLQDNRDTIVVDEFHHPFENKLVTRVLAKLIPQTCNRFRWILISRSGPALPFASWMADELMDIPINERDLRLTLHEAMIACEESGVTMAPGEVLELLRLSQGWAVAFFTTLRTLTEARTYQGFPRAARELVHRYLAEQVYRRLPQTERRFLLETSVLPDLQLDVLEKYPDGARTFERLRAKGIPLDFESSAQCRYYELFNDFLEDELRRQGPLRYRAALKRAALALENVGRAREALRLYARGSEHAEVLRILSRDGLLWIEQGMGDWIKVALGELPDAIRKENAIVLALLAIVEGNGGCYKTAAGWFREGIARASDAATRAQVAYLLGNELNRRDPCAAIELLEPYVCDAAVPNCLRALTAATLATALVQSGRPQEAVDSVDLALDLLQSSTDDNFRAKVYHRASYVYLHVDDVERAHSFAHQGLHLALKYNLLDIAARIYSYLAFIANELDDAVQTIGYLERQFDCGQKASSTDTVYDALARLQELDTERGNVKAIEERDALVDSYAQRLVGVTTDPMLMSRALRSAWESDFSGASRMAEQSARSCWRPAQRAVCWSLAAVFNAAAGLEAQPSPFEMNAREELRRCNPRCKDALRARIFLALNHLLRGRESKADETLSDAERLLGRRNGTRTDSLALTVRGYYSLSVRGKAGSGLPSTVFDQLWEQQLGGFARMFEALPFGRCAQHGLELLTHRERQVLSRLTKGESSKEIAACLKRSPQTVDAHVKSICRKLNCQGRLQAVALLRSVTVLSR